MSELSKIVRSIIDGTNPVTGEVFSPEDLKTDKDLLKAVQVLALITSEDVSIKKKNSRNLLNRKSDCIFQDLKEWRRNEAAILDVPAYIVFSDKELWSIAEGDVEYKEDLLLVKGINRRKYEQYGDALFEVLSDYI